MPKDPTDSITLRNRWGNDLTRRWRKVIEEVKRDVNANLSELIDRFVIGNGRWMLPYIREIVAKSETLGSRDLGEEMKLPSTERQALIEELHTAALTDLENVKTAVLGQAETKAAEAAEKVPSRETDIAGLIGVVGATLTTPGDTRPARVQAIIDRINKIGITRSVEVVAVRVVGGISTGLARIAKTIGAATVGVQAEQFETAGDERVCPICRNLESEDRYGLGPGIFPVEETAGIIPVHPRCRCRWVLIRVRIPIFNQGIDYDEIEQLFLANGWVKEQKPALIHLPSFTINRGEQGPPGIPGKDGRPGRDGKDGVVEFVTFDGEPGPMGKQGERGPRGFVGNQGERGEKGERGERGLQGERGEPGQDGRGIASVSFNSLNNELVIKYTDGKKDSFKLPMPEKRPFFGLSSGGGDRVKALPIVAQQNIIIAGVSTFPIVQVYDENDNPVTPLDQEYFPEYQAFKIELSEPVTGVISIIPGNSATLDIGNLADILALVTVTQENITTTDGTNIRTVL